MKHSHLFLGCILFVMAACDDQPRTDGSMKEETASEATEETSGNVPDVSLTSTTSPSDVIVWIGLAARWRKSPGEIFDGRYDSTNRYFKPCGQDNSILVPREHIDFEPVANCDTMSGAQISLMMKKGDSLHPVVTPLVPAGEIVQDKVVLVREGRIDSIQVTPDAATRIKEYRRAEVIRNKKGALMKKSVAP